MTDQQEEEDLRNAIRMSMQSPPEPKRSRQREAAPTGASPEELRRLQRELMAAAAEKRMAAFSPSKSPVSGSPSRSGGSSSSVAESPIKERAVESRNADISKELTVAEGEELFSIVFGSVVSKDILGQWTNQGIKFSSDPETSMGLVQHEGGPCGVLAALQAFVLKYLLFFPGELSSSLPQDKNSRKSATGRCLASSNFSSLTEDAKSRALVRSMGEILFSCGSNKRAVIASLKVFGPEMNESKECPTDEMIAGAMGCISIESASDLQKVLKVETHTSQRSALRSLEEKLPVFRSRLGAMLFLLSALLSRGLDAVQADRDDPSLPLVTAPFGHASQEIVNLLLSGEAVPNVFDGRMDLGGGMCLKGISTGVEVGFLTLLESLNFCKVGQHLKCPKWPIWVVGSESHYTVLFALDTAVQDENELEERESQIRRAFDAQDQSGGGGFISVESLHQVLREGNIRLPGEKLDHLASTEIIVWSEFWQVVLDLDKSQGGLKDSSGQMGQKVFELYHFNGIAKSDLNGSQVFSSSDAPTQRPRLTKLRVSVPPKWTPEEFMADVSGRPGSGGNEVIEVNKPEPPQHAPLVDCIRTRWQRAVCNWLGDPPSIV